jgi:DoxX-like family
MRYLDEIARDSQPVKIGAVVTETPPSKAALWTGYVISAIPVIFMTLGGLFFLFFAPEKVSEGMIKYGYPASAARPILIAEILCGLIYAIPQTATLGAVLLTAYLGGAVATHVHAGEPFFFPIIFAAFVWLGLWLRDARLRSLLPLRKV